MYGDNKLLKGMRLVVFKLIVGWIKLIFLFNFMRIFLNRSFIFIN